MRDRRRKGLHYEAGARDFLKRHGLKLLTQNYHCRGGEIDLIMRDGDTLCFIEVKYRRSTRFGGAACALPVEKQRRLVHTAHHYLAAHPRQARWPKRFDAVLMQQRPDGSTDINWIKNAFEAGEI